MVSERLLKFMNQEKITAARLAEVIDVQPSAISHIISGRNKPGFDFIQKIVTKFPRLNIEWLITGNGNMYKVAIQQSLFERDQDSISKDNASQPKNNPKNSVIAQDDMVTNVNNIEKLKTIKQIAIFYNDNSFEIYYP